MTRDDIIDTIPIFRGIDPGSMRPLRNVAILRERVFAGESLYDVRDTADTLFVALASSTRGGGPSVRVRVEIPAFPPVRPTRFETVVENDLFGEYEYFCRGMPPASTLKRAAPPLRETKASMLSSGRLLVVPVAAIAALAELSGEFRQRFIRLAAGRIKTALLTQSRLQRADLDASLATLLCELADDHATKYDNYAVFKTKIRQEEIADELGVSRRVLSERLSAWVDGGLIQTAPLVLLDLHRIEQFARIGIEDPQTLARTVAKDAASAIDAGELATGRAMALDFLKHFPSSPLLAFRAALAAVRGGNPSDALAVLEETALSMPDPEKLRDRIAFGLVHPAMPIPNPIPSLSDLLELAWDRDADDGAVGEPRALQQESMVIASETLSLQARLAKERAFSTDSRDDAAAACKLYLASHELSRRDDVFPLVNAASLAALAHDPPLAGRLAARAVETVRGERYWSLASKAEALLVLGRQADALVAIDAAMATKPADGMIASTRRQWSQLRRALGSGVEPALAKLVVSTPLTYCGVMLRPGQFAEPAADIEAAISTAAEAFFRANRVGPVYGSLAQGADILIAEAALRERLPLHVVLPFDIDAFVEISVGGRDASGTPWKKRFNAVIEQSRSVTLARSDRPAVRDLDTAFRHGFRCAAARSMERAAELVVEPRLLAVHAAGAGGRVAGTGADVDDWQRTGHPSKRIALPFRKLKPSGVESLGGGYACVVFCFPRGSADARSVSDAALKASGIGHFGMAERRTKDRRHGIAIALASMRDAVGFALQVIAARNGQTALECQVICDYGAARDRSGELDDDLLARLEGGSGLAGFPTDAMLATSSFAHELKFSELRGVTAFPLGQRLVSTGPSGRPKVGAAVGVYRLMASA